MINLTPHPVTFVARRPSHENTEPPTHTVPPSGTVVSIEMRQTVPPGTGSGPRHYARDLNVEFDVGEGIGVVPAVCEAPAPGAVGAAVSMIRSALHQSGDRLARGIVSRMVLEAIPKDATDMLGYPLLPRLLAPGDPVRDSEGRVVGCRSVIVRGSAYSA